MQELDDNALLREYVERDSEEAFAALVTRHVNKVYSVALRLTGNPHSAEEITQAVFVILARKSRHLGKRVILSGWLYQTARLTAVTFIRGGIRRARREQEACMQTALNENESDAWMQIAPLLDAAMAGLNETDRHAVVLRFFDGKSLREVGAALGANEEAAKKRVSRALEKLRSFFAKRGVSSTTAIIAGAISANSVQAAPVALAKSVTAVARWPKARRPAVQP
jgi:RNA polymerase sigma factor (sigma-70 family)